MRSLTLGRWSIVPLLMLTGAVMARDALVEVPGSSTQFPVQIQVMIGDKPVKCVLTGAALRRKIAFRVYSVASYLQDGVTVQSPEELVRKDVVKILHLVLERDLDGPAMVEGIVTGIALNYPPERFAREMKQLDDYLRPRNLARGQNVLLTHLPGEGLRCQVVGKAEVVIKNLDFARAIWDIYLGPKNMGDRMKAGLTSRL